MTAKAESTPDLDSFEWRVKCIKSRLGFFYPSSQDNIRPYHLLGDDYISDTVHLADGDAEASYEIFFELLKSIPYLIGFVEKYLEDYDYDMIRLGKPGLRQPKLVDLYSEEEKEGLPYGKRSLLDISDFYITLDELTEMYIINSDEDILDVVETRRDDYMRLIALIWLINLIRSNPPVYTKKGIFSGRVLEPTNNRVFIQFRQLKKVLEATFDQSSKGTLISDLIVAEIFKLTGTSKFDFLGNRAEP